MTYDQKKRNAYIGLQGAPPTVKTLDEKLKKTLINEIQITVNVKLQGDNYTQSKYN